MKIAYCIAGTCHSGGMERVLANKANWLAAHGCDVIVVTTDQRGLPPFFALDKRIKCVDLNIGYEENNGKSVWNKLVHYPVKQWKHRKRLTRVLLHERADITVSMFCNDAGFITKINDGSKKVLEIHFSKFKRLQYARRGLWRLTDVWRSRQDEKAVRKFDKFVVLTEEDKTYWGNLPNMAVIPNAFVRTCREPASGFAAQQVASLDAKRVIAIGRYTHQKGFDRLIKAWNLIGNKFPEWHLDIVGEGDERETLQLLIKSYGLEHQVVLQKPTKDIAEVYINASLLVASSRYEGLPMVMIEAQSYGLPIVSFACKCGPRDVVENGKTGILVKENDIEGLANGLAAVMSDSALRKEMGRNAQAAAHRYDEERIMAEWSKLFQSLL